MAKKKPDPTKKRVLVARHSNDLDFLIGLGASSGIQSSAPADDLGIDIGDESADVGGGTNDSIDIVALIKEAKASKVPRDLKFDDSSLPEASNFYQWAASPDYLNYTPFLEQILIGVRLFAEFCPTCSNVEWMDINNHEPQEGIPGMLKNVTLLEHGVCPKCNGRRSQFFKNKKLKFYNELAVCAGQRCVVGSTLLNTAHGLRRVGDLLEGVDVTDEDRIEVSGLEVLIDNKPCKVTHLIRQAKGEQLVCARLANGVELEGTESHGIESWASSYRPLAGADKSPVVVQRNTLTYNEMRCANIIRTVNPNQTLGEDRARKIILGLADTIGRMAVNPNQRTSFFVDNSDYLDVAYRLTKGCFSDNELIRLPDFLLTGGREIAHALAEGLDLSGDPVKLAGVSDGVARDIQTLLIGIGMPVMRHGRVMWLDDAAYNDFSSLKDDVLRTVPEFETDGWDRHSLRSVVYGFDHNHPLYSLRRLVLGEFSVFTANIEHTKPQHTWTLEVPCGQRYLVNGVMSENSGKSIVVAMLSTYITHRVLKMQKPTRFYNVGDNQILQGTFVALTQAQAKDTLWEPYYGFILTAPWFQRYHALIRRYEAMYGVDVMKIRDTFVLYRHRNLLVYPAGPDKRVLRGRCVTGSTMLNTNQGFLHFDELVKGKSGFKKARGMTVDSHMGTRKVSHTYKDRSKTIKVTTRNGYSVEGTPEHPMRVLTRELKLVWRRLDEMQIGDRIVSRTNHSTPLFGTQQVDRDVATLAGYLVANGFRNTISSDDPEVVRNLYETFERLTGHRVETKEGEAGVRASVHKLSIKGDRRVGGFISNYMEPIGYMEVGSARKSIPIGIRCASAETLHEFLEAYFQCDSGINGGSTSGSPSNAPCEIEVGSASKKLAQQLHIILLQVYGIVGRLRTQVFYDKLDRETGKFDAKRTHHLITITGGDAWKFLMAFKRAKVQKYADRFRDVPLGYMSDRRNVPYVREYAYNVFEDARKTDGTGKRLRKYVAADGSEFAWPNACKPDAFRHLRGSHDLSTLDTPEFLLYGDNWEPMLQLMQRIDQKATRRLRKLIELGAHFEEVTDIKHGSREKLVYDITVPKGHAFTANGLASHNTRVFYSIDEIGWFDNDASSNKVKTGANEVNIALERSCLTCRLVEIPSVEEGNDKAFTAYAMNVSSPSDYRDKICELLRLSQTSDKILGIHAPSWKMNPGITRESLAEEFRKSPITSARDYGASPPVSANPFITPVVVDNAMREKGRNEILYAQHTERRSSGISVERSSYGMITKIASCSRPSVLAIDAGEVNNSFAFTCTSKDEAGRARIDIVGEIMASPTAPINFTLLFDHILLPIIKARNVRVLLADRWQSNKILSDALALCDGLMQAKKYSLKYADMCDVRNMMQGDQLTFPRSTYVKSVTEILQQDLTDYPACFAGKPVEHFMYQLVTIQDARQQVVKGVGVTDDIWRSAALSVWGITNPDYALFLAEDKAVAARNGDPSRLGVIGSLGNARSGGSRQTTQSGVVGNLAGVLKSRR